MNASCRQLAPHSSHSRTRLTHAHIAELPRQASPERSKPIFRPNFCLHSPASPPWLAGASTPAIADPSRQAHRDRQFKCGAVASPLARRPPHKQSQMAAVPRVDLADLAPASGIATSAYTTACEKLAVAVSRHGAAVVRLPSQQAAALTAGLDALLSSPLGSRSLPGWDSCEWRAGGGASSAAVEKVRGSRGRRAARRRAAPTLHRLSSAVRSPRAAAPAPKRVRSLAVPLLSLS